MTNVQTLRTRPTGSIGKAAPPGTLILTALFAGTLTACVVPAGTDGHGAALDKPLAASDAGTPATGTANDSLVATGLPRLDRALDLRICPGGVSNPPESIDASIARRSAMACVNGVEVHVAPAPGACLSSGFGPRASRQHRGIDYHSRPAVDVVAAAAGVVRESVYRDKDLGHWVIIDHGDGVYTGYGHLAEKMEQIHRGATVEAGQTLGLMGRSGRGTDAVHLHYEVRHGEYDTPRRWWGLTSVDPFVHPGSCVADG